MKEVEFGDFTVALAGFAKAKLVTGEGSGIGLWLLDHILRAHEGELEIVPTDEKGLTTVRLWLPCIRSKKGGGTP